MKNQFQMIILISNLVLFLMGGKFKCFFSYMINKCSTKEKYIVIRLTEDMLMHEFAIINREFYSSNLKNFEVRSFFQNIRKKFFNLIVFNFYLFLSDDNFIIFIFFQIFGSVSYSVAEWKSLGNFTAQDIRDWQNFKLKKETWVRFLKVKPLFLIFKILYYGNK